MPAPAIISPDEYRDRRKDFCRSDGTVLKAFAFKTPPSWDSVKRSARFIMSTEEPDRDRDIIIQAGGDLTDFNNNPVALYRHHSEFPIGNWSGISLITNGRPKRTEGDLNFLAVGVDEDADRVARHVEAGSIKACSIGFIPKKLRMREQDEDGGWPGYEILEWELVECSPCPIPCQPSALVKMADMEAKMARLEIEEILDTWARDPVNGLLIPRKDYEAAYKVISAKVLADLVPKEAEATPAANDGGEKAADEDTSDPAKEADGTATSGKDGCDPEEDDGHEPEMEGEGCNPKPKEDDAKSEDRLVTRIVNAIGKLFKQPVQEPPPPPSEADVAAAKQLANDTLQRLKDAGLITD